MLEIVTIILGPVQTNAYLVADSETRDAAVIDRPGTVKSSSPKPKSAAGASRIFGIRMRTLTISAARARLQMR